MPQFGPDGTDAAAARLLQAARDGLPDRQGGRPARHGDRRLARRARQRQPAARPPRRTRRRRFIDDLGAAFRASGLAKPPLDLFSIHPYPANSSIPPTARRPALDLDRDRRLPEARAAADSGVRTPRRSSTASTGSRPRSRAPSSRSTPGMRARLDPAGQRAPPGRRLRRGDPARGLPAARADARSSSTSPTNRS